MKEPSQSNAPYSDMAFRAGRLRTDWEARDICAAFEARIRALEFRLEGAKRQILDMYQDNEDGSPKSEVDYNALYEAREIESLLHEEWYPFPAREGV